MSIHRFHRICCRIFWVCLLACMCAKSLQLHLTLCDPMGCTHQAPLSMGFCMQEYWSGLLCPHAGDLPNPGTEPESFMSPALAGGFFTTGTTWEAWIFSYPDLKLVKINGAAELNWIRSYILGRWYMRRRKITFHHFCSLSWTVASIPYLTSTNDSVLIN